MSHRLTIDAFPGFNEIDLAAFRIKFLAGVVDRVVIAECHLTQSGKTKPLYFSKWLSSCEFDLRERVEIIIPPLSRVSTNWEREIFTREFLSNYLYSQYPNAFFILSDLDEIPSLEQVEAMKSTPGIYHFKTPTFYRKSNWLLSDKHLDWQRGVVGEVKFLPQLTNGGRFESLPLIEASPGAHLSYFGADSNTIAQKYKAFAHTDLDKVHFSDRHLLDFCDYFRIDHLGRSRSRAFGLFHLIKPRENKVTEQISKDYPQHYDPGTDIPNSLLRKYASIYLSSYVRDSFISERKRILFKPSFYFGSQVAIFILPPLVEIFMSFALNFARALRNVTKNLLRKLTK